MLLSKTVYSWYIQGPFHPKWYTEGCHFGQNYKYDQKRVFVQYCTCTDKGLSNQSVFAYYTSPHPPHPPPPTPEY